MKEWSEKNKFNSFNSWKGLLYKDWYQGVINKKLLPPIEIALSPIHACNLECQHCNSGKYLNERNGGDASKMTDEHFMDLIDFFAKWGVKSVCFAGAGEPTLHSKLADAIMRCAELGLDTAILTNGTAFSKGMFEAMQTCTWVGVSIDAANEGTYTRIKGKNLFHKAVTNLEYLAKNNGKCHVSFKFLVSSLNQHEIFDACELARHLGVQDFHARPMDRWHGGISDKLFGKLAGIDIDSIKKQFEFCHLLETDTFKVHTVVHKFDDEFVATKDFEQCYGASLSLPVCADGKTYFCIDQWYNPEYEVGAHFPPEKILESWGKKKHLDMIYGNLPDTCKTRCTFGVYCKQCEELFVKSDHPMHWRFP